VRACIGFVAVPYVKAESEANPAALEKMDSRFRGNDAGTELDGNTQPTVAA
jgi:hypothetical protein